MKDAILKLDIAYFDGIKMIIVKKDTPVKIDLELRIALFGDGLCIKIEESEYTLFN